MSNINLLPWRDADKKYRGTTKAHTQPICVLWKSKLQENRVFCPRTKK